jgi:xanthine dehydrogenase accessory factor
MRPATPDERTTQAAAPDAAADCDPASDDEVLLDAIAALGERPAWLFTVAATWGASPRPAGSLLLVDADGRETGSVSGGCVEADLVRRVGGGEFGQGPLPRLLRYGVDAADAARFGMPCGGRLDLIVERIIDPTPWQVLHERVAARGSLRRRVCLTTGEASLHPLDTHGSTDHPEPAPFTFDGRTAERTFGPRLQLIIIGAVHITRHLVPIARALDYRVVVCEPRRERHADLAGLGAVLDARMPDDCVRALADDPRSAVVALTHDPKLDEMALMEALGSRAFYVGALGSRRTQEARRERLLGLGLTPAQVARLHGPVGLPLGGRTPAAIAVSIAAELVAIREGGGGNHRPRDTGAGGATKIDGAHV